jgi:hypothetical protein
VPTSHGVVRLRGVAHRDGHMAVADEEWHVAVEAAGLAGNWVVPADAKAPSALDAWLSALVGPAGLAAAGDAWVLTVNANHGGWRYLTELLGRDPEGDRRRDGALVISPDEAELLVENGLSELAPAALLLVDSRDASTTVAALHRGARTAAVAAAAVVVVRTRRDAVWLSGRGDRSSIVASTLASLPTIAARAPHRRGGSRRLFPTHRMRVLAAAAIAVTCAGATVTLVRHVREPQVGLIDAVPTATPAAASPSLDELVPRPSSALLAYDAAHKALVLVGCCDRADLGARATTWTWEGTTWTSHHEVAQPGVVGGSSAISEGPATGPVVLFDTNAEGDTWTWGGASWTRLNGSPHPPDGATLMAYDRVSQAVVAMVNGDTWTWDDAGWHPHTGRSAGFGDNGSVATDPTTGRVIRALDPNDGSGHLVLYRWTGTSWVAVPTGGGPSVEFGFQIAGDNASGDLVYLGPSASSSYPDLVPDTWVWDGHNWSRPPVEATPTHSGRLISALGHALFVEDAVRGKQPAVWSWTGHGWRELGSTDGLTANNGGSPTPRP